MIISIGIQKGFIMVRIITIAFLKIKLKEISKLDPRRAENPFLELNSRFISAFQGSSVQTLQNHNISAKMPLVRHFLHLNY